MIVQNARMNSANGSTNYKSKSNTSFKATPKQIFDALETSHNIGLGTKKTVKSITEIFDRIGQQINIHFENIIGTENEIPKEIENVNANGITLRRLNNFLNRGDFNAFSGESKFEFSIADAYRENLEKLGIKNPDIIEIGQCK